MVPPLKYARGSKGLLMAFACALVALCCLVAPAQASPGQGSQETLTVGVPVDRCPVFYRDAETGEVVGIGADLMRVVAKEAGYDVSLKPMGEATLKDALDNEEYDVVMPFGSAVPSASGHPTVVTENLMQTPFTLVTEDGRKALSLDSLRVGMLRSLAAGAETVRQLYPGMEVVLYDDMPGCVDALRKGEVDALLHNSYVWSYVLQKPSYGDLTVQPSNMFSMDFRAGTRDTPTGREVVARLNDGIAKIDDTQRQAIVLDYTSRRLYRYDPFDYLYQYGLLALLGLLLIAAVIAFALMRSRALRREQEEEVRRLIEYDPLTGALSLSGFRDRVTSLLHAHPDNPYLISYNNIKNFKFINDSLGMEAGDELLRFWASKTREVLSDEEAICRIGGDHFAVLRRMEDDDQILRDEQDVLEPVRDYFIDCGGQSKVQICTGIYALTPEDYFHADVDHMLDLARVAERKVRDSRKDGYEFYNPNQWERGKRVADVVGHLSTALHNEEFKVWYQPQVDYRTGRIAGAEALCRWEHSKLGWLQPSEFIPILEEAGLIYEMDSFVWEVACKDLRRWNEQGKRRCVSVNLSRADIQTGRDIPRHFSGLIQAYGISVDQLRVEITETAYAEDPDLLIRTTLELRDLGFHVEMDDFGSGYSSLHMLKEVPVDRIKLDLRFLTREGDAERGHVIVSNMIRMVDELGMDLIVEGVETEEQADFLASRGCSEMQGYYFHRPMRVEEFESLIQ